MPRQFGNVLCPLRAAAAPGSETRAGDRTGPRGSVPAFTSAIRSRLVAEMMRTSTFTGFAPADRLDLALLKRAQQLDLRRPAASSPTSSRNSVPPSASTNLPACFSVAPVKAPFSWPNKIDSTRFSGMAPQLTATNGLALRSLEPWIARAISSLPTPDSPSISTGMSEAAAFSAAREHLAHALAERVTTSADGQRAVAAALERAEFAGQRLAGERVAQARPAAARGLPA